MVFSYLRITLLAINQKPKIDAQIPIKKGTTKGKLVKINSFFEVEGIKKDPEGKMIYDICLLSCNKVAIADSQFMTIWSF